MPYTLYRLGIVVGHEALVHFNLAGAAQRIFHDEVPSLMADVEYPLIWPQNQDNEALF